MFFGWGRKSRQWPTAGGDMLVCSYRYLHIWWVFQLVLGQQWLLAGDQRSLDRQLSPGELQQMFPNGAPQLSLWQRYGLLFAVAGLALFAVVSNVTSSGT